jgi:hypothetical protein
MRQSLGPSGLFHVAGCLFLIARPANRNQPVGVTGIVSFGAQRQGRTMIEDDLAQ